MSEGMHPIWFYLPQFTFSDIAYCVGLLCLAIGGAGVIGAKSRLSADHGLKVGVAILLAPCVIPLAIMIVRSSHSEVLLCHLAGAYLAPFSAIAIAVGRAFHAGNPWLSVSAVAAFVGAALVNLYFVGQVYAAC